MSSLTFVGTQRPSKPIVGHMRFNTDTNHMETYDGTNWVIVSTVGNVSEYRLDIGEGTVFGKTYYTAEPVNADDKWPEMMSWMVETFGPSGTKENPGCWTPDERWYANNAKFWFKKQKDLDWFVLRWSS